MRGETACVDIPLDITVFLELLTIELDDGTFCNGTIALQTAAVRKECFVLTTAKRIDVSLENSIVDFVDFCISLLTGTLRMDSASKVFKRSFILLDVSDFFDMVGQFETALSC